MFSFRRPEDSGSTKTNISWKPDYTCRNSLKKKKIEKKSATLKFLTRQLLINLHKTKKKTLWALPSKTTLKYSAQNSSIYPDVFFYVRRGSAKLCNAKTSNSTAGLRNETSPDTKARDCWGTTRVVQYSVPLSQLSSSDAVRDYVRMLFRNDLLKPRWCEILTDDVDLPWLGLQLDQLVGYRQSLWVLLYLQYRPCLRSSITWLHVGKPTLE